MGRFYITLFPIGNFISGVSLKKLNASAAIIYEANPSLIFLADRGVYFFDFDA
jgi:hypothetical protein